MNEQQYQSLTSWVRRSPVQLRLVTALCRLLPLSLFVLYGLVSVYLLYYFFSGRFSGFLLSFWMVPAFGFVSVSIFRRRLNAPRPYDCFDFVPLLSHETGSSFPSRHTTCAFLIAFALLWLSVRGVLPSFIGNLALLCAVCTALSRLVAGLHFVRDICAGIAWAVICSLLYFLF